MPLYTRKSQAAMTLYGRDVFSTETSNRSPLRSFRVLPSYPSPSKRKELSTNASSSSFQTSYIMREDSDSDSADSTDTSLSQEFLKRSLLSKGHFEIDGSSDSDTVKSDAVSECSSYACEVKLVSPLKKEKAVSKFFTEGIGAICCICPSRTGQAWVCKNNNKILGLYHRNGHRKESRTLNVKIEILTFRQDGVLLAIPHLSQAIHKLSPRGKLTQFAGFELAPSGMWCTSRTETIVTTAPIKKSQKVGPRPRRHPSVLRLSHTGEVIWEIKAKGTEQFVDPSRVIVNRNGDICVLDHQPMRAHVVILTPDGDTKRCYYGVQNKVLDCPFDPKDLCCDRKGRLYVADLHSSAVHILDKQGNFMDFLITRHESVKYPTAIACDSDGFIWVGFSSGEIRVYDVEKLYP